MGDKQNKQQNSLESEPASTNSKHNDRQFNAGGNESDYDGGHPGDASAQKNQPTKSQQEHSTGNSYNSGGNDSDYDGGHPKDANSKNKSK